MSARICAVMPGSLAEKAGIIPGETLISINGNEIGDILDFRFFETEKKLRIALVSNEGTAKSVDITKREYESIGLEFETYLMDKQHSCKNKCVFCFVDQLPKGLRESLYFKDDDERLSFLFGNYVTLTNLSEKEIDRIIKMRISPINVSVHTTNPELRVEMMKNPNAAKVMENLRKFAAADIKLNCQLVLCPGYNDGKELLRSLDDLIELAPALQSIALVPVGLTKHREGLPLLRLFTKEEANILADIAEEYARKCLERFGSRIVWASDEIYLTAERSIPNYETYEEFPQLENGVGMLSLLENEFMAALSREDSDNEPYEAVIATGISAAPLMQKLVKAAKNKFKNANWKVVPIVNRFFGETITVAGLITGKDLTEQLLENNFSCSRLLIPEVMLRSEKDLFLDSMSVDEAQKLLNTKITTVSNDGYELLDALLGR